MVHEIQIYGPPGTGKTTELRRIVRELRNAYPADEDILISSFTRTAALHIAGETSGNIGKEYVATLHSFGYHQLLAAGIGEGGILGGSRSAKDKAVTTRWNDEFPNWAITSDMEGEIDGEGKKLGKTARTGDMLLAYLDDCTNRLTRAEDADRIDVLRKTGSTLEWLIEFRDALEEFKGEHNCITLSDMIAVPYAENYGPPYDARVLVVDETQDCSPLQVARIRQMASEMDLLILALDDDQAIYSFLGANPLLITQGNPLAEKRYLRQSYRVPLAVKTYAESIISEIKGREHKDYFPRADGGAGSVTLLDETWEQINSSILQDALSSGKTAMAIASCSYMVRGMVDVLRAAGLPYANKYRRAATAWNPVGERATTWYQLCDMLRYWKPTVEMAVAAYKLLSARAVFRNGKAAYDILHEMVSAGRPLGDELSPEECHEWFKDGVLESFALNPIDFIRANALGTKASALGYLLDVYENYGEEAFANPITVGTIHSVKGGEADCVVMAPDVSSRMRAYTERENNARLFYVAATRTKESLYVLCPVR